MTRPCYGEKARDLAVRGGKARDSICDPRARQRREARKTKARKTRGAADEAYRRRILCGANVETKETSLVLVVFID